MRISDLYIVITNPKVIPEYNQFPGNCYQARGRIGNMVKWEFRINDDEPEYREENFTVWQSYRMTAPYNLVEEI
jgi:hypothetical protein